MNRNICESLVIELVLCDFMTQQFHGQVFCWFCCLLSSREIFQYLHTAVQIIFLQNTCSLLSIITCCYISLSLPILVIDRPNMQLSVIWYSSLQFQVDICNNLTPVCVIPPPPTLFLLSHTCISSSINPVSKRVISDSPCIGRCIGSGWCRNLIYR